MFYIVLYCNFTMNNTHHITLPVQYSLPDDEHRMFETCRRQEELSQNIDVKECICWLTLHNCITMHGTKSIKRISVLLARVTF